MNLTDSKGLTALDLAKSKRNELHIQVLAYAYAVYQVGWIRS
jgi:hypothetical protein